jgi:hypothetical protein
MQKYTSEDMLERSCKYSDNDSVGRIKDSDNRKQGDAERKCGICLCFVCRLRHDRYFLCRDYLGRAGRITYCFIVSTPSDHTASLLLIPILISIIRHASGKVDGKVWRALAYPVCRYPSWSLHQTVHLG